MSVDPPASWPGRDGAPIACREKLRVLTENYAEAASVLGDVAEDARLMGVDPAAIRSILHRLVDEVTTVAVFLLLAVSPALAAGPDWLVRTGGDIQVLDKVNARAGVLTLRVGETGKYGSLTITMQGCAVRPPDQPADATARLMIVDATAGEPGFSGWMLRSAPAVSMLEHPIYDVRVLSCR